jgi:ubiquitin carboxyl-terminal hydrolase MINDY-1/2
MSQAMQASLAEAWYLKDIKFDGQHYRIITQNFNGCVRRNITTCALIIQYPADPAHSLQYVRALYLVSEIVGRVYVGNILILRGHITIQPPSRGTVSYEFLSQLVAEYLLTTSSDVDISAALSIMPQTQSTSLYYLCFCSLLNILCGLRGNGFKSIVHHVNIV